MVHVSLPDWRLVYPLTAAWLIGCGGAGSTNGDRAAESDRPASCPARAEAPHPLPGVDPRHRTAEYWIEQSAHVGDPDAPVLTAAEVQAHAEALSEPVDGHSLGQVNLQRPVDESVLREELQERLAFLHTRLKDGQYVTAEGQRVEAEELKRTDPGVPLPPLSPMLRKAQGRIPLRCGPSNERYFTPALDVRFDRNNCSSVRKGEPVQVLADWGRGLLLARTPYALGWISADAPLGAPLAESEAAKLLRHRPRIMTRRALLHAAFGLLDTKYGWGGQDGGRDCSRFLLDVFGKFGVPLPRHSSRQAVAGTFSLDVSELEDTRQKLDLLDRAMQRGIVLLHFPGHIMLYLGRSDEGRPMVLHAFAEYLEPCPGTAGPDGKPLETLRTVDRITVSDLTLGRGTSRRSFLERLTRITVVGGSPGTDLGGNAELRRAATPLAPDSEATCEDTDQVAVFRSPAVPNPRQPLRVIVTSSVDPRPARLVLIDPEGARHEPELQELPGPPWSHWVQIDRPHPGTWTALFGDGPHIHACERFAVAPHPREPTPTPRVWDAKWRWETDTENLYATWVARLFDYPIDEDLTWTNLQSLLVDRDRNLLFDHLSQNEDGALRLQPDCADLPYFLRGYFAWKLRLPFGFRRCSRGRAGRPPTCGDLHTNLQEREGTTDLEAFSTFIRSVRDGVHSASARTTPRDNATDVYPVSLTREALRPGTVFADPYGHLLVVAQWIPQNSTDYGILVGADAQPDGTIGRRRFWRGSFLFTPETKDVGAGFKAWRPLVYERVDDTLRALSNDEIRKPAPFAPWSLAQYKSTADDWYAEIETLINPRPLDPESRLGSLIDALEEAVKRRVVSVNNGLEYMQSRKWSSVVTMPDGYSIFETTGAWEDYATPARDLRLLISIDAVRGFPDVVKAQPDRFGLTEAEADKAKTRLQTTLTQELRRRQTSYVRSDGSEQTLTLDDIVARASDFEMAYNINDCAEIRWAAPRDSAEHQTCRHRAPREQRTRMDRYREWFQERRRPPR